MKAGFRGIVVIVGLGALLIGARAWIRRSVLEQVEVRVVSLGLSPTEGTDGEALVELEVRNTSRFAGTFEGLDGALRIGDRPFDHELRGLLPGDRLGPGEARTVEVVVPVTLGDVVGTAVGGLLSGRIDTVFDGELRVSAYGVEVPIPVHQEQALPLWKR